MSMSCMETVQQYALRSVGYGSNLLPKSDITLCQQFTLIGSGMIWNIYFGVMAIFAGFVLANVLAVAKHSCHSWVRKPADWFVFVFRGSPLFIQFFFAYSLFLYLKNISTAFDMFTAAWLGSLIVLFCNTAAYSGEIFYGALLSIPQGDIEAADAYGMKGWSRYRRIMWPTILRLAWPAYTNEAIYLFHATTLVFFSGFPARQQQGDALYYANYFAQKTFNPFIPYPIMAMYYILLVAAVITIFGSANRRLNRHLPDAKFVRHKFKFIR